MKKGFEKKQEAPYSVLNPRTGLVCVEVFMAMYGLDEGEALSN